MSDKQKPEKPLFEEKPRKIIMKENGDVYLKGKRRLNGLNYRSHLEQCERALTSELAGSRFTLLQVALRPAHWSPENAFQAKIIRAFHRGCKMLIATLRMDFTATADFEAEERSYFRFCEMRCHTVAEGIWTADDESLFSISDEQNASEEQSSLIRKMFSFKRNLLPDQCSMFNGQCSMS